ncbi:MAG: TonB-dependent receptor [Opitutaceae bacterium]|nr:TonB-dependent receptor [Opitutaceae bacterium]
MNLLSSSSVVAAAPRILAAVLVLSPAFVPSLLLAQQKEDPKEEVLQLNPYTLTGKKVVDWNSQMTFSGSRTAELLLDTPTSISILTGEYLADIGATNLTDIFRFGASGVTQRVSYRDDFTVRGFRQSLLRDGLAVSGSNTGALTPVYDVERVEVVKGPTALVFSNYGNLSGTVNYVTKRPTSYATGDASFSVGNYGTYIASVTQRGPLLQNGRIRYRVTGGWQEQSGWLGEGTDRNHYTKNRVISGSVDWTIGDRTELRVDAGHQYFGRRERGSAIINPSTGKVWQGSVDGFSFASNWSYRKGVEERFKAELIHSFSADLTVRAIVNTFYSNSSTMGILTNPGFVAAEAPNYVTIRRQAHHSDTAPIYEFGLVDLTWKQDFGALKNRINAGFQYDHTNTGRNIGSYTATLPDLKLNDPSTFNPPRPLISAWVGTPASRTEQSGWTAYAQDSVSLLKERLILAVGGRYVSSSITTTGSSTFVPSYGAVFKVTPTVSLYAGASESYTPRTGEDVFGTPLRDTIGESKEVGIKFNALKDRLFGTITYFDILNDPVFRQVQGVHPVTGQVVIGNAQVGKETNEGFEADIGWVQDLGPGALSTYLTYYNAEPLTATGTQPQAAVKEKYTVFAKYGFTQGPLDRFQLGGGASYQGSALGTGFTDSPAFTLYSAYLSYAHGRWKYVVNLDNLTDKRDAILGSEANYLVYLSAPRTFKLTASTSW